MTSVFEEHKELVAEKMMEYKEDLKKRIDNFMKDLESYWELVQDFVNWGDIKHLPKYKRKCTNLDIKLVKAMEIIDEINLEETAYGWDLSQYPLRKQTHDKLGPYKKLYDAGQEFADKYDEWMHSKVGSHDPEEIEETIGTLYRIVYKLEKQFGSEPATNKLASDVRVNIEEFRKNMPIIQTLGNPGMKERHWEQISDLIGFPIKVSPELTLEKVIDYGLEEYVPKFEAISESATKENNLEKAMSRMINEWSEQSFCINPYRDTGTYILSAIDDIQVLLDDHIIKTQTMRGSPYIKPFEAEIWYDYKVLKKS